MKTVACDAETRETTGKGAAHKMRREGKVPGVLYSRGGDNTLVQIDAKELTRVLSAGKNIIVNLKINGGDVATAMISEVQRDIYQTQILHVDFHRIRMDERTHSVVPIVFHGHAAGEKDGGVVDHIRYNIDIEALPASIPAQIDVDVSELAVGDSIHVSDIKLPEGAIALTDGHEMIVIVHPPRAAEAEETPAAETDLGAAAAPAPATT